VFSKVKHNFVISMHLNSEELDLESDLLLLSLSTFWGLSIFWVTILMIVVILKGTCTLTSKTISWSNLCVSSL
jgi:hypothetical protein